MAQVTNHLPATAANLTRCENCNAPLVRLLVRSHHHFCCDDCTHEWSARVIGATDAARAFRVLNLLREYLRERCNGGAGQARLARLCIACIPLFTELPLEELVRREIANGTEIDTDTRPRTK
jgi:hypothetical protein